MVPLRPMRYSGKVTKWASRRDFLALKSKIIKLLEENMGGKLHDVEFGDNF